jgi:hypothetical protein
MEDDVSTIHATLIHGTFAPNAAWTKEGSFLREELQKAFGDQIHFHDDFVWSGWPTHTARHIAAKRLKGYLLDLTQRNAGCHVLICHSHGGMVAAYALRDRDVQSQIAGLVTLSTPFLVARRRQLSLFGKAVGIAACIAAFLIVGLIFGAHGPHLRPAIVAEWPNLAPYIPQTYSALIGNFVFFLYIAFILAAFALTIGLADWLLATLELPQLSTRRTLIIRGPSDEASALLMLFHALELLTTALWGRRGPFDEYIQTKVRSLSRQMDDVLDAVKLVLVVLTPIGGIIIFAAMFWFYFSWHPKSFSDVSDALGVVWMQTSGWRLLLASFAFALALPLLLWFTFLLMVATLILVVGTPFVILMPIAIASCAVLAIVTVPEMGPAAVTVVVSTEAAPPGTFNIVQLPGQMSASDGFLTHSLSYTSPTATTEVTKWIRSLLLVQGDEPMVIRPPEVKKPDRDPTYYRRRKRSRPL